MLFCKVGWVREPNLLTSIITNPDEAVVVCFMPSCNKKGIMQRNASHQGLFVAKELSQGTQASTGHST